MYKNMCYVYCNHYHERQLTGAMLIGMLRAVIMPRRGGIISDDAV